MLMTIAAIVATLVAIASAQDNGPDERDRLANLSTTEKEELRRKREQFQQLEDSERQRLRELHASLASSPDRAQLEEVMLQYHEWLKTLPGKERADLLKLPAEEKIAEIKRLMQEQRSQQFRKLVATPPEPQDVRGIFTWFDGYVEAHEAELLALLPDSMQGRLKNVSVPGMRRKMLIMALHQREPEPKFPAPTEADLQKLNESLSPKAQESLAKAANPEEKLKLVQGWLRAAVASRLMPPQVSEERLMGFYRENRERLSKQDPQKVEELEGLPREAFYQEMRSIYFRQHGPWRGHRHDGDDRGDWRDGRDGGSVDGHYDDGGRRRGDRDNRGPNGNGPRRPRPNEGRPGEGPPRERPEGFPPPPPPGEPSVSPDDFQLPPPPEE